MLSFMAALSAGLAGAIAQSSQRSDASIKIDKSLEAMKSVTSKPYSFDQQGTLVGRTEMDLETWNGRAKQLSDDVVRARPSAIDARALDDIANQLNDPIAWDPNILDHALARIGSRAIEKLAQMIRASSDSLVRYHLSEHLASVVADARNADIDDHAIDEIAALLDHSDGTVRVMGAAQALGEIGPRARKTLPALEKELEIVRQQEGGLRFGRTGVDIVGIAISKIKGEPIHLPY